MTLDVAAAGARPSLRLQLRLQPTQAAAGDKDVMQIIQELGAMPDELGRALARWPADALHFNFGADEWSPAERFSPLEHVCHLRDFEREAFRERITRMLEESGPTLKQVDGYELAASRRYAEASLDEALREFAAARRATVERLSGLPEAAWTRRGTFEEFGPITLAGLIEVIRSHDLLHLAGLAWLRAKWSARRG